MDVVPLIPDSQVEDYARLANELAAGGGIDALWTDPDPFVQGSFDRVVAGIRAASPSTLEDAQRVLARAHGFDRWEDFTEHVDGIAGNTFEAAADAVVGGDLATLLSDDLVRERSARRHHATLLHYVAANGVEDFRQKSPANAVAIATLLLDAGAEVDALADTYGGGPAQTTLNLLVSSVHPAIAGVQVGLVELLADRGAAVDGVADDGSPLMTALGFGYPAAAQALAARGARVDNVVVAAGLGRLDVVRARVGEDRVIADPWGGDVTKPEQHALVWAARYGHAPVVEFLLDRGVPITAMDSLMPLHWAAAQGHMDVIELLLARGAPLEALNEYGGTVLDSTLWFVDNAPVAGVDYADVIRRLLAAGARADVRPGMRRRVDEILS
ncbi:ankyrin repeat domain-containing protein [Solirubrobacter soli]|uniref:ankyrin repeat domain-containing protein n=1 Tax=Solirubrobacter soli TaxID=363832 RepID=UPI00040BE5EF|nr:ankyrin repeat domain-containing protein [Solirubrobacter soli]